MIIVLGALGQESINAKKSLKDTIMIKRRSCNAKMKIVCSAVKMVNVLSVRKDL